MGNPLTPDFRPQYHQLHRVGRPGAWRSIVGALLLLLALGAGMAAVSWARVDRSGAAVGYSIATFFLLLAGLVSVVLGALAFGPQPLGRFVRVDSTTRPGDWPSAAPCSARPAFDRSSNFSKS